ncbi:hypothetical protein AVEN_85619-1, partial [Araneus ventricosus]
AVNAPSRGGEHSLNVDAPDFVRGSSLTFMSNNCNKQHSALLSTAVCYLIDASGKQVRLRCLLDAGSQMSFLKRDCVEMLGLKKEKTNILVSGLNDSSIPIKSQVTAMITNENKSYVRSLNFLVVPKITAGLTPSNKFDVSIGDFSNIKLADEKFNVPERVDMLLGVEVFYELLRPGQISLPNSNLLLQNTVFGFIVSGGIPRENENVIHCGFLKQEINLDQTLKQFWEIENVESDIPKSRESNLCEEHFQNNHSRDKSGRYIVKMPLKENPDCLGKSRHIALKKLNSLWNRFVKDPELLTLYSNFMHEYLELGHMYEIKEIEEKSGSYYIPHLGVFRPESKTSPLRVVFNASTLTTAGNSLNSIQYNGGVIQDDLFSIMIRFRKHAFAFTADIKKMYRMILVHPSQRQLQRILWKDSYNGPIKTYELATVTYGTASAPFLAMRTLKQLAIDERKRYPAAATVLESDLYMDDVLSGSDDLETAKNLQRELIDILSSGKMSLHKWCSNTAELAVASEEFGVTKRLVLSTIARVFDPLGILGPVVTKAKIFLQRLWLLNLKWDDPLPAKEADEWIQFSSALQNVNDIEVDRCILLPKPDLIEIHGFADASEAAYGAAVYCKSRSRSGEVSIKLIASKSRVSPIKRLTIPKLELCSAVLLAKLVTRVISALKLDITNTFLWSDSMIVLCWLQKEPCYLKTFVANRVSEIQKLTNVDQWRHVSSHDNPADLISRGVDPDRLSESSLWWSGPEFLTHDSYPKRDIPSSVIQNDFSNELKNSNCSDSKCFSVFSDGVNNFTNGLIDLSNNYCKIIRILSYIYRFINNCKNKSERKKGPLESGELKVSELFVLRQMQNEHFVKDVNSLRKKGEVSKESQLRNLHPFLDTNGLVRVGGRLGNSELSTDRKYPILLPSKARVTHLILQYYHRMNLHVGPQSLLFHVRQKYWPLNGRTLCREIVHKCVTCFKAKPVVCEQLMGALPKERVTANFPFNCTGVDFTGPFSIKYKNQRKGVCQKIYVSLFICFVTKCVHLELVTELTSEAFVATLKRFFSRRGKCSKLFSDNATNFVGSNQELRKLHSMVKNPDGVLSGYLSSEGIDWKFLPPRAPNFGGLWEAGVKSFKHHLKRVVGNSKLTFEEFLTVTTQIEGILNSRPLVPLTTEIEDLNALTPAHFLIGRPINSIVEPNLFEIPECRLKIWQKLTKMIQIIWKRWSNDYLCNLQQRGKWFFDKNNVRIGDLVIIKEDNMAVCNWPLGRIVELFPGNDNKIRVVGVKTQKGFFKRPISKVCLLPIEKL